MLAHVQAQGGDAVDERLAADKADIGIVFCVPCQMFAMAEADFHPDLLDGRGEKRRGVHRRIACGQCNRRGRQDAVESILLLRAQFLAFAPSVELAFLGGRGGLGHDRGVSGGLSV